jgi:hypothetical protein
VIQEQQVSLSAVRSCPQAFYTISAGVVSTTNHIRKYNLHE